MRTCITLLFAVLALQSTSRLRLLDPADSFFTEAAAPLTRIRLDTTAGVIVIDVHRAWAPRGADRFVNLVRAGFYNGATVFRIRPGTWAQFGIPADPAVAQTWRSQTFPDDPFRETNRRGTVAFAFAVPNGRTTQVFINLRDNSATHDKEPFVPFGRVTEGLDVADRFYATYGEGLGGIRAGKQDAAFAEGNAFFDRLYPKLDRIKTASIVSGARDRPED